jgi:hypothetical protein
MSSLQDLANPPSPKAGVFEYRQNGPSFFDLVEKGRIENSMRLKTEFTKEFEELTKAFNLIYLLASRYMWVIYHEPYASVSPVQDVLFPCFHKSLISLYVAHDLSREGLYGPARPHLRQAFESLMIAKYCSANPESDVFDRWIDGVDIYFTNAVLKKIKKPVLVEIPVIWKILCEWTHSTVFAGQPDIALQKETTEVQANIGLIGVFLRWTTHLMSSHMVTPSVRYYGNRYTRNPEAARASKLLKQFFTWQYQYLGEGSKALIKEYRARWTVC